MIKNKKMSIPCSCGGILKKHHTYDGKEYWYCEDCNSRYDELKDCDWNG